MDNRAIPPASGQDSHMRVVRGALAVGCLLGGCWLMLRALGLLAPALDGLSHWWPTSLFIIGTAIFARSLRPGPHIAVAVLFILGGCISFAVTRDVINGRIWIFAAAAGLISTGTIFAWANVAAAPKNAASSAPMIFALFRAADFTSTSTQLERVGVFLLCGHLDLHLEEAVEHVRNRNTIVVEITSLIGTVQILVRPGTNTYEHAAFVKRFRQPLKAGMLIQDRSDEAHVAASTLAIFGGARFRETGPPHPAPGSSDAPPEQDGHLPATQ
jgi:hypothetical protein